MSGFKYLSLLLGLSLLFSACQFDTEDKKEEETVIEEEKEEVIRIEINGEELEVNAQKLEEEINTSVNKIFDEIATQMEDIGEDWKEGEKVEMMDHRVLKALLPSRLGWMKQTEHSSEKAGALGFRVTTAEARYEYKDKWIEIELVDLGGLAIARLGLSFWDEVEVERESKEEYEKTYEKNGNKYHDKYNKKYEEGELTTVYNNRYVLNVEGKNVKLSELEKARDKVKTHKLE